MRPRATHIAGYRANGCVLGIDYLMVFVRVRWAGAAAWEGAYSEDTLHLSRSEQRMVSRMASIELSNVRMCTLLSQECGNWR
jgi:hypothetical protein